MIPGEGKTTGELFEAARALLTELETELGRRRRRERACTALTDLHLALQALARRVGGVEWAEATVCHEDEDELEGAEPAPMELGMRELMAAPGDELEAQAAAAEGVEVWELRLRYFRLFLDFQVAGCRTFEEVALKCLALVRRLRPEMLERFGLSMAEVGRKTGRSRANIHAFEKRMLEELLKGAGARGFHGLGGQRGAETRERCRRAQQGNQNRRNGEARKRAEG
ncbi:MAG TPA: hypothetical protein PK490_12290 [Prosthecobacter sp.]|nr:hypothetical protein [Prosthecobacter sp.]HRK15066.1 hypothetical protein [Prosthecobacter sp.]